MTLDEAIAYAYKVASEQGGIAAELLLSGTDASEYLKCKRKYEQLAEWLEELKSYRASVFSGDMTRKMLKEEYCKAVDDFAESVKTLISGSSVIRSKDIDEIVEQLKEHDHEPKKSKTPRINFDVCCESIESMAQIIDIAKIGWTKEQIVEWLKKEECEVPN